MNFDRAWILAIAWLPLAWMLWEWRHTSRRLALALKALCFTAILLALAEPTLTTQETKVAAMVLVDTSASTSDTDLQQASQWAAAINSSKGRHVVRIIPFARNTRAVEKTEQEPTWRLRQTSGEAGRGTDLEAAVREAIA